MSDKEPNEKEVTRIRKEISRIGCIGNGGHNFSKGLRIVKTIDWDTKSSNEFVHEHFDKIFNYRPSWFDNEFSCSDYAPNIDMDSIEFKQLKDFVLSSDNINYDPILKELRKLDENIIEGMNPYGYTVPTIQDYIIYSLFPERIGEARNCNRKEWVEYLTARND